MSRVFISYRREDTDADAGRLYDELVAEFGEQRVYKDVDSVPLGEDFGEHISAAIDNSALVIALVGPSWDTTRLSAETDWVRFELEAAFRKKVPVLPIYVRGAKLPPPSELPESISRLSMLNAGELEHGSWRRDLQPIMAVVRGHLGHEEAGPDHGSQTAVDSWDAGRWSEEGVRLAKAARLDEAVAAFHRSLDLDPRDAMVLNNLGFTLNRMGRHREALMALDQAIQLDPKYSLAHDNRASALRAMGRSDDASKAYRKARRTSNDARRRVVIVLGLMVCLVLVRVAITNLG